MAMKSGHSHSESPQHCRNCEMAVRYTKHAEEQMASRQITKEQVELVLRRPIGDPEPGNRPDTIVFRGLLGGGRALKVVVDAVDTELVVTAFREEMNR